MPLDAAIPEENIRAGGKAKSPFEKKFPNAVARDKRLSPVGLVLTAYRSTFVGKYKLLPNQLSKLARKGLGKNAAKAGIANMRAAGCLDRRQPASAPGTFAQAEETLSLPEGKGRLVARAWFDGTLDAKEMAALIYLRAGTGRGKETWRRELEDRFGWAPRTAARVLGALVGRDLVVKTVTCNTDGTHRSTTYSVPQLARDRLARSGMQNQGNGKSSTMQKRDRANPACANPACANPGHSTYLSGTPHSPPSEEHLNVLPSGACPNTPDQGLEMYAPRALREAAPTISNLEIDRLHQIAEADRSLLGWLADNEGGPLEVFAEEPPAKAVRAVYEAATDAKLRKALREATDRRIAYILTTPQGLHALRWLAAVLMAKAEGSATPIEALASVLDAIFARIADQSDEWLNSYALIGKRLAGDLYGGGWAPRAGVYTAQGKQAALDDILAADGAKTLSAPLRRDVVGLDRFVREQASKHRIAGVAYTAEIEAVIANKLRSFMIDGRDVGSIKSWRYFEAAVADEMHRCAMKAAKARPGDGF